MAQLDEMRLIVRVARMYYEWDVKQAAIARQLGLSQPTVSRLLQQAKSEGIIRISVNVPQGIYTDLEEQLVKQYRLRDAIVVDCSGESDERFIERQIGAAAAYYLESALRPNEVVGISSWSDLPPYRLTALPPYRTSADDGGALERSGTSPVGGTEAPSARSGTRMPRPPVRNQSSIRYPYSVSTDSGWNCTPTTGCVRCTTAMISPSSAVAVTRSSGGSEAGAITSE